MPRLVFSNSMIRSVFMALRDAPSLEEALNRNPHSRIKEHEMWKELALSLWDFNQKKQRGAG